MVLPPVMVTLFRSIEIVVDPSPVPRLRVVQVLVLPIPLVLKQVRLTVTRRLAPPPPPFPSNRVVLLEVRVGPARTSLPIPVILSR